MQIKCELDNYRGTKKGGKATFAMDAKQAQEFERYLANFKGRPLLMSIDVDAQEMKEILGRISEDQRRKIYALLKDIGEHTGQGDAESVKPELKLQFCKGTGQETFSLSDCSRETAKNFIEWLVMWCFAQGVPIKDKPQEYFEDPADYMQVCLRLKKCAVCGRPGEEHHYDAVGMGRNRQAINDEGMLKMSLCRLHHTECHTIGKQKFCEKYHLQPVLSVPQRQ